MTQPIPTEVWAQVELRRALAERDIPEVYRLLTGAGIQQRRIAALTGQRQSEVSEIILRAGRSSRCRCRSASRTASEYLGVG